MYEKELKGLVEISRAVGVFPEYVQGGGGNTSVKLSDELMAIKASGYMLREICEDKGFVVINYKNIKDYYEKISLYSEELEKSSNEKVYENIVKFPNIKDNLRPSVEAGFHTMLEKFVVHTHSVYANILCCSEEGREIAKRIFKAEDNFLWIPYSNPGVQLSIELKEAINECKKRDAFPEIIFLENHGVIITSSDSKKVIQLHEKVSILIKNYFNINVPYPEIKLTKIGDQLYKSNTEYLKNFLTKLTKDSLESIVLYPDQLVYLNSNISESEKGSLKINYDTGEITYKTNEREARVFEETLLAYVYILDQIQKNNLSVKTLSAEEINFIKGWESEEYRRKMIIQKKEGDHGQKKLPSF